MEALFKFTQVDPNRNVFDMMVQFESTATANWRDIKMISKSNYTRLQSSYVSEERNLKYSRKLNLETRVIII